MANIIKKPKKKWWDTDLDIKFDQCFLDPLLSDIQKHQLFEDYLYQPFKFLASSLVEGQGFARLMQMDNGELINDLIQFGYFNASKYKKSFSNQMARSSFIHLIMRRQLWNSYKIFKNTAKEHVVSFNDIDNDPEYLKHPPATKFEYSIINNHTTEDFLDKLEKWWIEYGNSDRLNVGRGTGKLGTIYMNWLIDLNKRNCSQSYFSYGRNMNHLIHNSSNFSKELGMSNVKLRLLIKLIGVISKKLYNHYIQYGILPEPENLGGFRLNQAGRVTHR